MKRAEREQRILYHQHLASRCDTQTATQDALALQTQFLRHAQMSLRLETRDDSWKQWVKQSVETRASRGTLHLLDAEDRLLIIPALWEDYGHHKYYMARYYTPQKEQLSYSAIFDLLQQGTRGRRKIYTKLAAMGLDKKLYELAYSSWGSLFAVLNIQGRVIFQHAASRELTYASMPLQNDLNVCRKELVYRYLKGYGPVALRGACYFFGRKKKELEAVLQKIHSVQISGCNGSTVYELPKEVDAYPCTPTTMFLSGFSPLMLGYEEHENPFLPQRCPRRMFNLQGTVYPYFLCRGNVTGRWKLEEKTLQLQSFEDSSALQRQQVERAAKRLLQPARAIWVDF